MSEITFPKLVLEEYEYYKKEGKCLNSEKFEREFGIKMEHNYPPCFFAGKIHNAKFALVSINPGYNAKRNEKENAEFQNRGGDWKSTYLGFFEWFMTHSNYYNFVSVLLDGLLGNETYSIPNSKNGFNSLNRNLVNLDLIPYHSSVISTVKLRKTIRKFESEKSHSSTGYFLLKKYSDNLIEMTKLLAPKSVVILNGGIYSDLVKAKLLAFNEETLFNVNSRLTLHLGFDGNRRIVLFDKYMSRFSSYTELFEAGKKIRAWYGDA